VEINSFKIWVLLMKLGSKTGCHQLNERSFFIGGYQFPLCARCAGLFIGHITGLMFSFYYFKYDLIYLLIPALIFLILLSIDGFIQYVGLLKSTNSRRIFTGITCGYFVTIFNVNLYIWVLKYIKLKIESM